MTTIQEHFVGFEDRLHMDNLRDSCYHDIGMISDTYKEIYGIRPHGHIIRFNVMVSAADTLEKMQAAYNRISKYLADVVFEADYELHKLQEEEEFCNRLAEQDSFEESAEQEFTYPYCEYENMEF